MIEIGEIWRRPGPCGWIKIIDVMIPGYPTHDGGAPGVSVQFSGLGKRRTWIWLPQTWFILAHNEAAFALKMLESGRKRTAPGTPISGIDPFADRGPVWPSAPVEVEL